MEKGESFGSGDVFRERRKTKRGVPLAALLSFNDRDVHPHCPNASNPYHKCERYCLDKIPALNELLDGERSGGSSSEWERVERKVATSYCANASNPYHKCADYCFQKVKREDLVKEPVQIIDEKKVQKKVVIPISLNALNSFHKYTEHCFSGSSSSSQAMKTKEQKNVNIVDRGVNSNCKYAANPYHICAEYCFQEVPGMNQTEQGMKLKSPKETKRMVKNTEITGVNPHCRYASNPYHKCAEYCFQNMEERDKSEGDPIKEKRDLRKERKAVHPVKEKSSIEASNTRHDHTDFSEGISKHVGALESNSVFSKEEKEEVNIVEFPDTQPLRIDASDLFKEWAKYCSLKAIEDSEANKG